MKGIAIRVLLTLVPMFSVSMFLNGCSGCSEDIRLIRTCSWKSQSKLPCKGSDEIFEEIEGSTDKYNLGICKSGRIECRRDITAVEEYCPSPEDKECYAQWDYAQYDDVCVGYTAAALEKCGNTLDDDCDGEINEGYDVDEDGFQDANKTDANGHRCGMDCDDNNAAINPYAGEVCDGLDNNCNCLTRAQQSDRDTNDDGIECGCSAIGCDVNVDELPNGLPISTSDANGGFGNCFADNEPYQWIGTPCSIGKLECTNGAIECSGAVGPEEEQCDGIDNNCNGWADEPGAIVGEGDPCGSDIGMCLPGYMICDPIIKDMICINAETGTNPDVCDGVDNDCDMLTDEDAPPNFCHNGCPTGGFEYCIDGVWSICDAPGIGNEEDEPCNGLDDDCDGMVDEGQECECDPNEIGLFAPICTIAENMAANPPLTCGQGRKDCECVNGDCQYGDCYLACDPWVNGVPIDDPGTWFLPCPSEVCDSWDHNCYGVVPNEHVDGLIDVPCNCDVNSPIPEIAQAALNGNCEEGECTAGQQTCEYDNQTMMWTMMPDDCDAVGPVDEVCDELDNDCDGDIDEDLNSFDKVDMVFAIDITGSMGNKIIAVRDAIAAYAVDFQGTEHRFALMLFPAPYGNGWAAAGSPANSCNDLAYWTMTGGLVNVQGFIAALDLVLQTGLVCGSEPTLDVLQALVMPQDPAGIGWRNDAYPYVFLIGDENPQSFTNINFLDLVAPSENCDGIGGCPCTPGGSPDCDPMVNEFEIHCFLQPGVANHNWYDNICYNDVPADNIYDINNITAGVLRGIFADVCLPSNGNQQPPP